MTLKKGPWGSSSVDRQCQVGPRTEEKLVKVDKDFSSGLPGQPSLFLSPSSLLRLQENENNDGV